jgi:quaternary ammonium compound-resistance protein SugE
MSWTILIVAGLLEIGWAVGLKLSDGLSKPLPAVVTIVAMIASLVLLGIAVRTLPLGTAYAVWTGIGAVGSVLFGIMIFREPVTAGRLLCVAAIIGGIVGLKLLTPAQAKAAEERVER